MQKLILLLVFTLTGFMSIAQSKNDTSVTVQDALDFLNAKFKINHGLNEWTDTLLLDGNRAAHYKTIKYTIDTVYMKSDSIIVIRKKEMTAFDNITEEGTLTTFYINLNEVSQVKYSQLKYDKQTGFGERLIICADYYYISAKTDSSIMTDYIKRDFRGKGTPDDIKFNQKTGIFSYSECLTNEGVNPQDFNAFAKRIGSAFNFIINTPVRPRIAAPKEKF